MIHVLDGQTEKIVATLENKVGYKALYWDDRHIEKEEDNYSTYEFVTVDDESNPAAEFLVPKNKIIIRDLDGFHLPFTIEEVEQDSTNGQRIKRVYAEGDHMSLKTDKIIEPTTLVGATVSTAMEFVLYNTRWKLGIVEFAGSRTIKFDDYMTALAAVNKIASEFDVALRFRVEIRNNEIVTRYVDVLNKEYIFEGKEITFGKDLIGVKRIESSSEVYTALYAIGPADENGKYVTIESVNNGLKYVEDQDALQRWSPDGKHLYGIFKYDPEDGETVTPQLLKQKAQEALKNYIDSSVKYEVQAAVLEQIPGLEHEKIRKGMAVRIKDEKFNPPLYLEARVLEVERSYTQKGNDKFVLGNYRQIKVVKDPTVAKIQSKLFKNENAWSSSARIIRSETPPEDVHALWIDTSIYPNIPKTYDFTTGQWVKASPTIAAEIGAETPEGAQQKADNAKNEAIEEAERIAEEKANLAEEHAKQYTDFVAERKIYKQDTPPVENVIEGDLWIDTSVTPNVLKRWNGTEWVNVAPVNASDIGAVDIDTYNETVQQLANDIAEKVDAEWVNGQLQLKENKIVKSNTAPSNPTVDQLWLDTSSSPNVLKRWNGSAWVKVTPTSAGEVGAYTKTEVDNALNSKVSVTQYTADINGIVTQLNDHESRITQTENEIATKVSQTTYNQDKTALQNNIAELETRISNAETAITQNANEIALKANKTDVYTKTEVDNALSEKADDSRVDTLETRVSNAEAQLTVQAGQIATKVSQTEFTQELAKKENSVIKSSTAPSNPTTDMLWLDTSVTPNVLKRWNGSTWVKATPTTAGEVGAYTKSETDSKLATKANQSDLNTLTTRVSTAETNITQLSNQISLKANASDVYTKSQVDASLATKANQADLDEVSSDVANLETRMSNAEAQLTVQADQIATKVSQTEFTQQLATKANASDVYTKSDIQVLSANNLIHNSEWKTNASSWTLSTGWTRDTSRTFQGSNTMKVDISGLSSDAWRALYSEYVTVSAGQELVASGYTFTDDMNTIDRGASLEIEWFNANNTRISTVSVSVKPTANNTWQRFSITGVAPTGTVKARIRFHPVRNGRFWVSRPMLQYGKIPTAFTPHVDELATNIVTRLSNAESSIMQQANQIALKVDQAQYNIDLSNLNARLSSAESTLTIQAGQISSKVDVNGVISAINQSAEQIKIQASKIALDGYVEAKHIKSLNGLNINNKFIVDASGNVTFAGTLNGANGTFNGAVEVTSSSTDEYGNVTTETVNIEQGRVVANHHVVGVGGSYTIDKTVILESGGITIKYSDVGYELGGETEAYIYNNMGGLTIDNTLGYSIELLAPDINLYGTTHLRDAIIEISYGIKSGYNNSYFIKDHANGNITLSAAGGDLFLGYYNTNYVKSQKEHLMMAGGRVKAGSWIIEAGDLDASNGVVKTGAIKFTKFTTAPISGDGALWYGNGFAGKGLYLYLETGWTVIVKKQ